MIISMDRPGLKSLQQALEASSHRWTSNLAPMLHEARAAQSLDMQEDITATVLRALADVLRYAATDLDLRTRK